jgi:hypothetical protein
MSEGAAEFEITPDMIAAAASELINYEIGDNDPRRIIGAILVAMGAVACPRGFLLRKRMVGDDPPKTSGSFFLTGGPGRWKIWRTGWKALRAYLQE